MGKLLWKNAPGSSTIEQPPILEDDEIRNMPDITLEEDLLGLEDDLTNTSVPLPLPPNTPPNTRPISEIVLGDVSELLIYHQPGVKPSLTLRPFGVLGYVAGHSLT
jgi:hypothetical protein